MKITGSDISSALSGEFMLNRCWFETNGGDVIVSRSLWISFWVSMVVIGLQAWIDPKRVCPSWDGFREQVLGIAPFTGALFGGAYLALYARFSSQWGYLAGLYNQIKQVESSENVQPTPLAAWKAGFIEDAESLHLACKSSIAPIIHHWAEKNGEVEKAFVKYVPGGQKRLNALRVKVAAAEAAAAAKYA